MGSRRSKQPGSKLKDYLTEAGVAKDVKDGSGPTSLLPAGVSELAGLGQARSRTPVPNFWGGHRGATTSSWILRSFQHPGPWTDNPPPTTTCDSASTALFNLRPTHSIRTLLPLLDNGMFNYPELSTPHDNIQANQTPPPPSKTARQTRRPRHARGRLRSFSLLHHLDTIDGASSRLALLPFHLPPPKPSSHYHYPHSTLTD